MPSDKHKAKSINLLKAAGITLLAFGLSLVLMQPFSLSIATLISSNDRHDFNITDFYNIIADRRQVRELDRDIVILDIKDATREDVAVILDVLPELEPRAVGLDVMFDVPHDDDSLLLAAIAKLPDMVMIVDMEGDRERGASTFHIQDRSFFFDDMPGRTYGASNMPTKYAGGVVRQFVTDFPIKDSGTAMPSFAAAVAAKASPEAAEALRKRGNRLETINYPSRTFTVIPWQDLAYHADELRDRVVLIGAMNVPSDMHATPPQKMMSGIEIHAHTVSTILGGRYLNPVGQTGNMAMAFALCFALAFIHVSIRTSYKALVLRILQIVLLYYIIRIGYHFFIDRSIIINFSYTLLMMTFVLFACDIWLGAPGLVKDISRGLRALFRRVRRLLSDSPWRRERDLSANQ